MPSPNPSSSSGLLWMGYKYNICIAGGGKSLSWWGWLWLWLCLCFLSFWYWFLCVKAAGLEIFVPARRQIAVKLSRESHVAGIAHNMARHACCAKLGDRQQRVAAEAMADVTSVRKKIAFTSTGKTIDRVHPPQAKKISEHAQCKPWRGKHVHCIGTGGGLPQMVAKAMADVTHGGDFLCVCVSVTVIQKLWFFTQSHTKVIQTTKPLTKKGHKYNAVYQLNS